MPSERTAVGDIQAITRQIHLYCRAMDRLDAELGYSIWHEDGLADYGAAIFQGTGRGFVDFALKAHKGMTGHSHQVANVIIDLDGDRAVSESYVTAALRMLDADGLKQMTTRGRYLDEWAFRGGRWAISKRAYVHDFDDTRRIDAAGLPSASARDKSDTVYLLFNPKA